MFLRDERGFTLAELLVAMAAMSMIAAATFGLLEVGLRSNERLDRDAEGMRVGARLLDTLRSEIGAAQGVIQAASDSLTFTSADGTVVRYVARVAGSHRTVYRLEWQGAWVERPARPLGRLEAGDGVTPRLDFSLVSADRVRVEIESRSYAARLSAAPWREP